MAKTQALPLVAPTEMLVQPVPVDWALVAADTPSGRKVVLQLMSPTGVQFYFFPTAQAKELGDALTQAAGAGIIVVPAGTVVR